MKAGFTAIAVALGAGLALLTGCEGANSNDAAPEGLTDVDFVAETINGQLVIGPGRVTMAFVEGRVTGRGGCNHYSGPVEYDRGKLKVGPLISTKMACAEPGLMQQESAYLNTLGSATTYAWRGDGRLVVSTPSGGAIIYTSAPRQVRPEN